MNFELSWNEDGKTLTRIWMSESEHASPRRVLTADDTLKADDYYRQASEGAAFVYRGDFQNAKQLLQAVQRRIDRRATVRGKAHEATTESPKDQFHRHRQAQAHRAQLLSRLLISVDPDFKIPLRRAPDLSEALREALPPVDTEFLVSLREMLGFIGAHEWRKKGVSVPTLGDRIHPHYGVFSPARGEYLDLIAQAPFPEGATLAFDIGTGTGVIAALLAKRGIPRIIATDSDPRALACARENLSRLGFITKIEIQETDLFPEGAADLIICNPPWLPARATSPIERAIYDEDSRMLRGFLRGVRAHLTAKGEAWLVLSDLAEQLGLRSGDELQSWIAEGGLSVVDRLEIRPRHPKASDPEDPLHQARAREITRLWRLSSRGEHGKKKCPSY